MNTAKDLLFNTLSQRTNTTKILNPLYSKLKVKYGYRFIA